MGTTNNIAKAVDNQTYISLSFSLSFSLSLCLSYKFSPLWIMLLITMVRKFVLDPVKEKKKEKKLKAGKLDPHLTLITVSLPGMYHLFKHTIYDKVYCCLLFRPLFTNNTTVV